MIKKTVKDTVYYFVDLERLQEAELRTELVFGSDEHMWYWMDMCEAAYCRETNEI